jgi:hypothetical protein
VSGRRLDLSVLTNDPARHRAEPKGWTMTRSVIVEAYRATDDCDLDLRLHPWELALDQRAFGPRRLLVAFADRTGRVLMLAHTRRLPQPEDGLAPCIELFAGTAEVAVAFCDEPVTEGPIPAPLVARWERARDITEVYGIHLVDWFSCDDDKFRSTRLAIEPDAPWWDVP